MPEPRIDHIVRDTDGNFPNDGKPNLCHNCGGDPTIATGHAAIGTAGCICAVFSAPATAIDPDGNAS